MINAQGRSSLKILRSLIFSRGYLALFAGILSLEVQILALGIFDYHSPCIASLLCLAIYSLNRFTDNIEDKINNSIEFNWVLQNRIPIYILGILIPIVLIILLGLQVNFAANLLVTFLFIFGTVYSINPFGRKLKSLWQFKTFLPVLVWVAATVFLPNFVLNQSIKSVQYLLAVYLFVIVFELEIFFDMRDRAGDFRSGIKTLAMMCTDSQKYVLIIVSSCTSVCVLVPIFVFGILSPFVFYPMIFHRFVTTSIELKLIRSKSSILPVNLSPLLLCHGVYLGIQLLIVLISRES